MRRRWGSSIRQSLSTANGSCSSALVPNISEAHNRGMDKNRPGLRPHDERTRAASQDWHHDVREPRKRSPRCAAAHASPTRKRHPGRPREWSLCRPPGCGRTDAASRARRERDEQQTRSSSNQTRSQRPRATSSAPKVQPGRDHRRAGRAQRGQATAAGMSSVAGTIQRRYRGESTLRAHDEQHDRACEHGDGQARVGGSRAPGQAANEGRDEDDDRQHRGHHRDLRKGRHTAPTGLESRRLSRSRPGDR